MKAAPADLAAYCAMAREQFEDAAGSKQREKLERLGVRMTIGQDQVKREAAPALSRRPLTTTLSAEGGT